MAGFVSIPSEVEAIQNVGGIAALRQSVIESWGPSFGNCVERVLDEETMVPSISIYVEANGAWLNIEEGEWIIKDAKGIYPCKDDVFREKYRPMDEAADDVLEENAPETVETDGEFDEVLRDATLREELTNLLNRTSRENLSGTADFVLAHFLMGSLETFEEVVKMRAGARSERWEYDIPTLSAIENKE